MSARRHSFGARELALTFTASYAFSQIIHEASLSLQQKRRRAPALQFVGAPILPLRDSLFFDFLFSRSDQPEGWPLQMRIEEDTTGSRF
jgi:hypothetical protein